MWTARADRVIRTFVLAHREYGLVLGELPEVLGQSETPEYRLGFVGARGAPVCVHPPVVPNGCQVIGRLHARQCATPVPCLCQPRIEFSFRPKAVNSASRELDVVPEPCRWHHEVDHTIRLDATVTYDPLGLGSAEWIRYHPAVTE
jgi:hypothetical protein